METRALPARTIYCSFCGKSQSEVRHIVAGPTVYICDGCILLSLDILIEGGVMHPDDLHGRIGELRVPETDTESEDERANDNTPKTNILEKK